RSGRPGPVLVSLPEDMLQDYVDIQERTPFHVGPTQPNVELVNQAAELLYQANNPIIIAGGGVVHSKAQKHLVKIAELLKIPVVTAFRRFTAFPNSHPNYVGYLGMGSPDYLLKYIKNSDVILGLGTRFSQPSTNNYTLLGDNTKLIHVDVSANTIGKVYNPFLPIVSDVKEFSKVLLDIISPKENSRRSEKVINLKKEYINFSVLKRNYSEEYVDMDGMMYDLNGLLPTDTIITNDAGNFFTWLSRYYQFNHNDNYIGPTSGAMGYGIPAAIGAKISQPNRTVVSFSGDGGAMMT